MLKENYTFWSSDSQTKLHAVFYKPEGEVIATLVVAHGIGEYIERYEELADFLTFKGIVVAGFDCIGHGKSVSERKAPMYFGKKGSWEYLVKDFIIFNHIVKEIYPNVPCFLMGFSMGSFVVRYAMATKNVTTDGAIFVGTGRISPLLAELVKFVVSQEDKKVGGDDKVSDKVNELAFGNYNKYFEPCNTEFDWLCRNKDALKEYIEDPLTRKYITPGMFRELLSGMAFSSKKSSVKMADKNIPILFVSGKEDPVGEFGKGVIKTANMFSKFGFNTTLVMYPNIRHDVFHDDQKHEMIEDMYSWMKYIIN